jgi:hypothetical protein
MPLQKNSLCLISWIKLAASDNAFYDEAFKLAFLWFDELVVQSPREEIVTHAFPAVMATLGANSAAIDQICKHIHPIQSYFPKYEFLHQSLWDRDAYITESTVESLAGYYKQEYGPNVDPRALAHEVGWTAMGVIDAINLVGRLSSHGESFMLPDDIEDRVLRAITRCEAPGGPFPLFEDVARYRLPRLKELSWDRVIDLRHHKFLENFRRAIQAVRDELRSPGKNAAREAFAEIERKNLKELLSLLTPSVGTALAKGILTNLPVPMPVNPVGLIDSILAVRKEHQIAEKFGWIYFLYELDT